MAKVAECFFIKQHEGAEPFKPRHKQSIGMYMEGQWYELQANEGSLNPS
jgi:uncharacterized protein (DUF1015 family)